MKRPGEPPALAVQPPAARLRVDARLDAGRLRRRSTRRSAGRPVPITEPPFSRRRTVYGFIDRQNLDGLYRTFDFAVPDATSPRRFVTTVPQQALFLMNSPFLHEQIAPAGGLDRADAGRARPFRPSGRRGRSPALPPRARPVTRARRARAGRRLPPPQRRRPRRKRRWSRHAALERPVRSPPGNSCARCLLLTNEFMFVD